MQEQEHRDREKGEHYQECPVCHRRFDMRDLAAVLEHEHLPVQWPKVSFSHVRKKGLEGTYYVKGRKGFLTLKEIHKNSGPMWGKRT
jgi:hypothetical protein